MRLLFIFCAMALLVGCTTLPTKEEVCSGSFVKGCSPTVYFEVGSAELNADAKKNLDWAIAKMKRWDRRHVVVVGYADPTGNSQSNMKLSEKRAHAVGEYLFQHGIIADRIGVGYRGENDLICNEPVCYDVDRRVTVEVFNPKHWWIF